MTVTISPLPPVPQQSSSPVPVEETATLVVQHLHKTFHQGKQRAVAVQDVSLSIRAGEVLAFLGPNGAGKTTTIKMIAGLIRPDHGQVRIAGYDPHRHAKALKTVGAVLEGNRNLYWRLTPAENLEYFGVLRGLRRSVARRRGLALLEQFGLTEKRNDTVQKLSRGMQQKLAIAVALVHQPQLLLLDEPTLGLDVEASQMVKTTVRDIAASGCAILLTTHQLDVAEELSDQVAIIRQGEIIAEKPTAELIQEFSGTAYVIEVEGELDGYRANALRSHGATVQGNEILYNASAADLYGLLEILKPLPIAQVKKDRADLTHIFLKLIRGEA